MTVDVTIFHVPGTISDRISISDDGCWEWQGRRSPGGYGICYVDRAEWFAHRYTFTVCVAPIPAGLEIDHLCRNRACCNPAHLETVTHQENMRRSKMGQQTHCKRGHEYTAETTRITTIGRRQCRVCESALKSVRTSAPGSVFTAVEPQPESSESAKRCQYMIGPPEAEEPTAWCRLEAGHAGGHDLDYDYDRTDHDREMEVLADLNTGELMALIGDARIRFWMCPNREHRYVNWRGDVAYCAQCEASSAARVSVVEPAKDGEQ